jgi:hypothetical protein
MGRRQLLPFGQYLVCVDLDAAELASLFGGLPIYELVCARSAFERGGGDCLQQCIFHVLIRLAHRSVLAAILRGGRAGQDGSN